MNEPTTERSTEDQLRGTGRSIAGILRAIATALENPDQDIPFVDHAGMNANNLAGWVSVVRITASQVGVRMDVSASEARHCVLVKSPLARMVAEAKTYPHHHICYGRPRAKVNE